MFVVWSLTIVWLKWPLWWSNVDNKKAYFHPSSPLHPSRPRSPRHSITLIILMINFTMLILIHRLLKIIQGVHRLWWHLVKYNVKLLFHVYYISNHLTSPHELWFEIYFSNRDYKPCPKTIKSYGWVFSSNVKDRDSLVVHLHGSMNNSTTLTVMEQAS